MSSPKKPIRDRRPIGLVLPTLVLGIGIVALWTGVPKEITIRRLRTSGKETIGKVVGIEHTKTKTTLSLGYVVQGAQYIVPLTKNDADGPATIKDSNQIVYLPTDPTVSTADLDSDAKTAHIYTFTGLLELFGGGLVLVSGTKQRVRMFRQGGAKKTS